MKTRNISRPSSGLLDTLTLVKVEIPIVLVSKIEVPAPAYQSEHAAGMDLCAAVAEPITLEPGQRRLVPTGYAIAIPQGFEGQVRPRSGLALKYGITVLNAPGTVDADYRGELQVLLINHGAEPFVVRRGDRIAQLVITPYAHASLHLSDSLSSTERGAGGYGSTGTS